MNLLLIELVVRGILGKVGRFIVCNCLMILVLDRCLVVFLFYVILSVLCVWNVLLKECVIMVMLEEFVLIFNGIFLMVRILGRFIVLELLYVIM